MTIPATTRKAGPYSGTGAQTAWPFTFKVFATGDIAVTIANAAGVETLLTLGSDYSVTLNSNQDTSPGGTVTYPISGSALPVGSKLSIVGDVDYDQPYDIPAGGNFSPTALENQLDRTIMQVQQLKERNDRALVLPVTASASTDTNLPLPEAQKLIGWDVNGTGMQNYDIPDLFSGAVYADWIAETFTGTGAQTVFVLQRAPGAVGNCDVSISGVTQVPNVDFTLSGNTVAFVSAPANGLTILVRYGSAATQVSSTFSTESAVATAGQTIFNLTSLIYTPGANALAVYVNGLRMVAGVDYVETNFSRVTFTTGLTLGDEVIFVAGRTINDAVGAEQVSFLQAGTGAVARTGQSKMRDFVSVKDFGAVGDGVADDTAAMNAAATAAGAAKKALFVPAGVYKMTAPWAIPIKVYVLGESPSLQAGYDPGNAWQYGAIIFKAHTGNGVTKTGASAYDVGAPLENITVSSHRTTYPGGNGFVIDKCSNVHLIRCNVFGVGGDCYVLGVTAGDVTGHNYTFNCYSNNPTGAHYRVRQKWGRFQYPVTDGGTVGMIFDNASMSQVDGFHFEGFTQAAVKITNGSTNCVLAGRGYVGHTTPGSVVGIEVANDSGNGNTIIENVYFGSSSISGAIGVRLYANAVGAIIKNCTFSAWDTGINTVAGFGNTGTTIVDCAFDSCGLPIYTSAENTTITGNKFLSTVGSYTIQHAGGTKGLWSNNVFDKTLNPAVTSVQGDFSGIKVKENVGYVSRNRGTTGAIAAYANIAHGLAGIPKPQIVLTSNTSGITSFPQLAAFDATNFSLYWTGAATGQWNWEAALPCDY